MSAEILQASVWMAIQCMFSETLPPVVGVPLAVAGFAGVVFLFAWGMSATMLKMAGWKALTERFPMKAINLKGVIYPKRPGTVGSVGFDGRWGRGPFDIRVSPAGLGVYPRFARRQACLIPWSAIKRVAVGNVRLTVSVRYDRTCDFDLPAAALPDIQARVPADLFHQNAPAAEAIGKALLEGGQPVWMRAIWRSAEKETERRLPKDKRDDAG